MCSACRLKASLAIAILAGCGGTDVAVPEVEMRDSAGVRIVVNPDAPDEKPLQVSETLRIGLIDGDEPYIFSRITAMARDESGNYYVANTGSGTIRVFAPNGDFIREFGRKGDGPGEFRTFMGVFVVGDTVAAVGSTRGVAASLFTRAGDLIGSWSLSRATGLDLIPTAFLGDGWIGYVGDRDAFPRQRQPGNEIVIQNSIFEIFPEIDSVGPPIVKLAAMTIMVAADGELSPGLFRVMPDVAVNEEGRVHSTSGHAYRIDVHDRTGRHVMAVERSVALIPITNADVEHLADLISARWDTASARYGISPDEWRKIALERFRHRADLPMSSFRAPIRRILTISGGGFWVERVDHVPPAIVEREWASGAGSPNVATYDRTTAWDVFDEDGQFLRTVELPPRFAPLIVTDSGATGVLRDELDVEYVASYVIAQRQAGATPRE